MQSILAGIMIGNSVHSRPPIVPRIKRTIARGRGTLEVAVPLYKIFCSRTAVNQRNIVNPGISRTGSDKAQHGTGVSIVTGGVGVETILTVLPGACGAGGVVQGTGDRQRNVGAVEIADSGVELGVAGGLHPKAEAIEVAGLQLQIILNNDFAVFDLQGGFSAVSF